MLLHEWKYDVKNRPLLIIDEEGNVEKNQAEPVENLVTWVYADGGFTPSAKIQNGERFSIINDYLGTPIQAYNEIGEKIWERELSIYGEIRVEKGLENFIPFTYQGQYFDSEIELCYNRYRYYSPDNGIYVSQDPIGLDGNNPNFYGFVRDSNVSVDVFGLSEIFTASNGLSLEVKNAQDLSHLSEKELKKIYHANNNPKGFGKSPINSKGETIILHHQKQMNSGPIIEMPRSAHNLGNKKQHPFFPNSNPNDPVDRARFDEWRKEYWKNRAEIELNKKGIKYK